jgi:hypothetical protein
MPGNESVSAVVSVSCRVVIVDTPMVEAPLLLSDAGGALTLLNWTSGPRVNVR